MLHTITRILIKQTSKQKDNKSMDDYFPFQKIKKKSKKIKRSIPNGISLTNRHMFILDGHASHVTLEAIEQA